MVVVVDDLKVYFEHKAGTDEMSRSAVQRMETSCQTVRKYGRTKTRFAHFGISDFSSADGLACQLARSPSLRLAST